MTTQHPDHLITLTTETGPLHVDIAPDGSLTTRTDREPVAKYADLGELLGHFADAGIPGSLEVADAAWKRILRRRDDRARAIESRDELSMALASSGLTHAAEVVDGRVVLSLTPAEADALADALTSEEGY